MIVYRLSLLVLLAVAPLSACAPLVVGGGAVATGFVAEKRGSANYLEDNWVAWKIRSYYVNNDNVRAGNINVSVYRGKVLLTGTADSKEEIAEAIRVAKATRGVTKVTSELKVQRESASELAKDSWISNQVKFKLLADEKIRGLDIHVETTKSVVFLTGLVSKVAERNRAVEITQGVPDVREVVSYIELTE